MHLSFLFGALILGTFTLAAPHYHGSNGVAAHVGHRDAFHHAPTKRWAAQVAAQQVRRSADERPPPPSFEASHPGHNHGITPEMLAYVKTNLHQTPHEMKQAKYDKSIAAQRQNSARGLTVMRGGAGRGSI